MAARLTKPPRRCKNILTVLALLPAVVLAVDPHATADANSLRDCVARAQSAAVVAACEKKAQAALKSRVQQLSQAIRIRLEAHQRLVFDRSTKAWQAFFDQESAMLELTLELRGDGLGETLRLGEITRMYEQREKQLRQHLYNLNLAHPGTAAQ